MEKLSEQNDEVKNLITKAINKYYDLYKSKPLNTVSCAPGRVNLMGGGTDYNGGFVFPMVCKYGLFGSLALALFFAFALL